MRLRHDRSLGIVDLVRPSRSADVEDILANDSAASDVVVGCSAHTAVDADVAGAVDDAAAASSLLVIVDCMSALHALL